MNSNQSQKKQTPKSIIPANIMTGSSTFQRVGRVIAFTTTTIALLVAFAGILKIGKVMVKDVKGMGL